MKKKSISSFLIIFLIFPILLFLSANRAESSGKGGQGSRNGRKRIISRGRLERRIRKFNPIKIAHLPTPLEKMRHLSYELREPIIFIKRDDQTGLAFGGNKARKLDFIIADVWKKRADVVITWAGVQSNWCRQTAAAVRRYRIKPILVLFRKPDVPAVYDGNLLLDFILDADIRIIETEGRDRIQEEEVEKTLNRIAEEEKKRGHNPYIVPVGGSSVGGSMTEPLGAISYTKAFIEIYKQARRMGVGIDYIVLATGSGSTQAGLLVGAEALCTGTEVIGISVSRERASVQRNVSAIANDTARALGLTMTVTPGEVVVFDDYIGDGYGILNQETADAIRFVAKTEGIILDPVYTGKAMAGLIDLTRRGYFDKGDVVVFLHTGGTPALFVYRERLMELLKR